MSSPPRSKDAVSLSHNARLWSRPRNPAPTPVLAASSDGLNLTELTNEHPDRKRGRKRLLPVSVEEIMRNVAWRGSRVTAADLTRIVGFSPSKTATAVSAKNSALFNNIELKSVMAKEPDATSPKIPVRQRKLTSISDYFGNIGKLNRNSEALKNISPPALCPAYQNLIDGFSPRRLQGLLMPPSLPPTNHHIPAKRKLAPKRSLTIDLNLSSSNCSKKPSAIGRTKPTPALPPTQPKFQPQKGPRDEWVLIADRQGTNRLLYNIAHLFEKYGIPRDRPAKTGEIAPYVQRAMDELLEGCSYHMTQSQRDFEVLCDPNGNIIKDIRSIPLTAKILIVDSKGSLPPSPIPQIVLSRLEIQRLRALNPRSDHATFPRRSLTVDSRHPMPRPLRKRKPLICPGSTSDAARNAAAATMASLRERYDIDRQAAYKLSTEFMSLLSVDRIAGRSLGLLRVQRETVLKFSPGMKERNSEVAPRILAAAAAVPLGETSLGLEDYVRMNMLLRCLRASKGEYVRFWTRYLDPTGHYQLLEKLSRPCHCKEATAASSEYARELETSMRQADCVDESGRLDVAKLGDCMRSGVLSVEAFNKGFRPLVVV